MRRCWENFYRLTLPPKWSQIKHGFSESKTLVTNHGLYFGFAVHRRHWKNPNCSFDTVLRQSVPHRCKFPSCVLPFWKYFLVILGIEFVSIYIYGKKFMFFENGGQAVPGTPKGAFCSAFWKRFCHNCSMLLKFKP